MATATSVERRAPPLEHALDPGVGAGAILARRELLIGELAHALREPQPQHDGHGPELADGERPEGLVGGDVADQALEVDPAVGVTDEVERQRVDARIAGVGPGGEPRQLHQVAAGQI